MDEVIQLELSFHGSVAVITWTNRNVTIGLCAIPQWYDSM